MRPPLLEGVREMSNPEESTVDVYYMDGASRAVTSIALAAVPRPRVRNGLMTGVVRNDRGVESVVVLPIVR